MNRIESISLNSIVATRTGPRAPDQNSIAVEVDTNVTLSMYGFMGVFIARSMKRRRFGVKYTDWTT
jgi:hypothetical protein